VEGYSRHRIRKLMKMAFLEKLERCSVREVTDLVDRA